MNIRLSWKGLPGRNTLAYYEYPQIRVVRKFYNIVPWEGLLTLPENIKPGVFSFFRIVLGPK